MTVLSNFREFTTDTDRPVICDIIDALDDGLDASFLTDADCRLLADYTLPMIAARALGGPGMSGPNNYAAFPLVSPHPDGRTRVDTGMTLRDYFAGQALVAHGKATPDDAKAYETSGQARARAAYQMADAMLRQREADQ